MTRALSRRFLRVPAIVLPVVVLLCSCATGGAAPGDEPQAVEGLVRKPSSRVDTVYAAPGATLSNYRRVILDPVEVTFKEDWQKRRPEIDTNDVTRIVSQAGAAFREIFGFALSANGGFGLTTQPDPDVLRVTTRIAELDVAKSSATAGTTRPSYVVSSGDVVLTMELRDSSSGALLVRAIDRGKSRAAGDMEIADSVSNSSEARRTLEMWAGLLRAALDEARAAPAN